MTELEIANDNFAPLTAAQEVPATLSFEDCDLVANAPPRDLSGVQVLNLAACTLDSAALHRWLTACPHLNELDIEECQLGDLSWSSLPAKLQTLAIRGGELRTLTQPRATGGLQVIELTACQLQRVELPKSLGSLQRISLAFNRDLGACPELPWSAAPFALDLRGCGLKALPTPSGIDKVGTLDASDNPIEALPEAIAQYHSLGVLRLQKCRVSSLDPAIQSLPHLRELWLADNPLPHLPDALFTLGSLTVLELARCQLTAWPTQTHEASKLEVLLLAENQIQHVPDDILQLKKLRNLSLWKTGLQSLPKTLQGLTQLQQLDVSYNPLTKLPDLRGLPALGYLGLCGLRDLDWQQGFDRLAALARIRNISLTNSNFATFDRRVLDIPELERLDVNKTPINAAVWQACRKTHPSVTIWGS